MKIDDNPFERFGLNPRDDERRLTSEMRQKSRRLPPAKREELQRAWRELTADPVAHAQAVLLTPPPVSRHQDLWTLAEELAGQAVEPELAPLTPNLEDALVMPLLVDEELFARPPFFPGLASTSRNDGEKS